MTSNQFENIIPALIFTGILPPSFKDNLFEIFHIIVVSNDHIKDFFIPS